MRSFIGSRATMVWILLVAATVLSWEVGHGFGFRDKHHAGMAIIVVAFVKVRFVVLDFMEIRSAPRPMRIAGESAVIVLCTALLVLYLRTPD